MCGLIKLYNSIQKYGRKEYDVGKYLQTEDVFILSGVFFILIAWKKGYTVRNFVKNIAVVWHFQP